jgi:hypothetical protein
VADREGRSTVSADKHAAKILEGSLAATHVGAEGFGRLAIRSRVVRTMACQFVPVRNDSAHQRRVPFCNPTQGEKGRLDFRFRENVEQAPGILFDTAGQLLPTTALNCGSESLDLEIIFNVDS